MDMKIIKEFLDNQYSGKYRDAIEWHWGCGKDGFLYYRFSTTFNGVIIKYGWHKCSQVMPKYFSISDMKRISDQFGHLILWI